MFSFSDYRFALERQPLARPFTFKGGSFSEKWINVVRLFADHADHADHAEGAEGADAPAGGYSTMSVSAVGSNAVLWSDSAVAHAWSEAGGNALMTLLAERALQLAQGVAFEHPVDAFQTIRPELHRWARRITGRPDVSPTFCLNSMVALDFALWKLYALHRDSTCLQELLPAESREALCGAAQTLARVPLISYTVPAAEVSELVGQGHRVLKIKLGQAGEPQEMVQRDSRRLEQIHRAVQQQPLPVHYYLDANGRYPDLDTLLSLLDRIDTSGILDRVIILEEPFAYQQHIPVHSVPLRVAADESLHDIADLQQRADLGYRALALKPAGKTLSLSVLMATRAARLGIPCFVADSACVPSLVQWNLAFAALLPPFAELGMGLIETNGAQHYANWTELLHEHSARSRDWLTPRNGVFTINQEFMAHSGGVFTDSDHYSALV